jgi:hypothetical protein
MNNLPMEYPFLIALTVGVAIIAVFPGLPPGYLSLALLALLWGIFLLTRTGKYRGFYLVCGGEPLVVACGMVNLWAGLFSVCMLAGMVCGAWGMLESRHNFIPFALFCGGALVVALIINISNHVPVSLLALGCIAALVLAAESVRMYTFRKQFTGARP